MNESLDLTLERFPRAARYHPDWIRAGASGGANPLQLTEWLAEALPLRPGMRVLDLGCGRAMSSIFLRREYGVQVWATDLWFNPTDNLRRIRDAGVEDGVYPLHGDARSLPFAAEFFDAILSMDSFLYYGTDDRCLNDVIRLVKPGGRIGIAQAGLTREMPEPVPLHLREWWRQDQLWCLHEAAWWRRHWARTGLVDVEVADTLPDGGQQWLDWLRRLCPEGGMETEALAADAGRHLGYIRVVASRRLDAAVQEPIVTLPPTPYERKPLLRGEG